MTDIKTGQFDLHCKCTTIYREIWCCQANFFTFFYLLIEGFGDGGGAPGGAVEQGTADFTQIFAYGTGWAGTFLARVIVVANYSAAFPCAIHAIVKKRETAHTTMHYELRTMNYEL